MSAKNIIVGEIRTVLSRLRMNNRYKQEVSRYNEESDEINLIEAMESLLFSISIQDIDIDSLDTEMLLGPFIIVLKSASVNGLIVESVLTALDTFFQSQIVTEKSINISTSISILLNAVSRCRFEATDRSQDEVVLVHMLELLRSTISLPIGNVLSDSDIWSIFDTVFVNSQEVGYSRLLRKVAERVLRDITIIIFRRFSYSSTLRDLRQRHIHNHKITGMQLKIQRGMSLQTVSSTPQPLSDGEKLSPSSDDTTMPSWDAAALHIITFLSSRINPNARGVGVSEDDSNNTLILCLRLMRMALESCGGVIASSEPFFNIISDEFFKHLLMLTLRPNAPHPMLSEILRIFSFFAATMRVELKLQLEVFFQRLVFWSLEGKCGNDALTSMVLEMLTDLSYDPSFLVDLYVNYDCDPQRCDLLEALYKLLSELVLADMSSSPQAAEALHIMSNGMKCIDRRIDAKLEEQQKAIEEGCNNVDHTTEDKECSYHISPQMLWVGKLKKRTLQKGALVFSTTAKEGIKYLQEAGLIPDPATPADIARFLRFTPGLDKQQIGEYLGKNNDENKKTLFEYVRTFDFCNTTLLTALRMFLDTFRLPGEAQQIDRVMETFAQWAYEHTIEHDILINPDVTYCVSFSVIMLNTDLHNPNMKPERRMQLKDFIKLNKLYGEVNQGRELNEDFLVSVYKSIASEQIFTSSITASDQLRNEQWVNVMRQTHTNSQQFIAHSPTIFENCQGCSAGMYDRDIFSILWGPLLASAGATLEIVRENRLLEFSLETFVTLAHIAAYFSLTNVLDSLVYFLAKFSRITTEYITEDGENDPIEYVVVLGEKASTQLSLISLFGIVRKLGSNLGKSWEEVIHALCHMYFLGLFPVTEYVQHQCQLLSDDEKLDLTVMVDGLVEERFSKSRGIFSRLFAWSPEVDSDEKHIQMAPIDPEMWDELRSNLHSKEKVVVLPVKHHSKEEGEEEGKEKEEENDQEESDHEESDHEERSSDDDIHRSASGNPYELSFHEAKCIESVLECVDKCRLDLFFISSVEWSNSTLLIVIDTAIELAKQPYQLAQRKEDKEHRVSVIACMYSRAFIVEFLTGLFKSNIKRIDVIKDTLLAFLLSVVEDCTYLNQEVQYVAECSFDLIFTCINYNSVTPVHKLFSILSAITRLVPETFYALAPLLASGFSVLIAEYGRAIAVIGCWETVIEILHSCIAVPHAVIRCYKCIVLLFSDEMADSLPPCTLSLIEFMLNSPYITPEVYSELLEDLGILSRNCWRIYTRAQVQQETEQVNSIDISVETLWLPLLRLVCGECKREEEWMQILALDVVEDLMCSDSLLLLPSIVYGSIIVTIILPTIKDTLLQVAGINHASKGKPRVTRMKENALLTQLDHALINILQRRFETLLLLEGFTTIWSQIISILQFIQSISVVGELLQTENTKTIYSFLQHAASFDIFKTEEGQCTSELWKQTVSQLSSFKEEELKKCMIRDS